MRFIEFVIAVMLIEFDGGFAILRQIRKGFIRDELTFDEIDI